MDSFHGKVSIYMACFSHCPLLYHLEVLQFCHNKQYIYIYVHKEESMKATTVFLDSGNKPQQGQISGMWSCLQAEG